MISKLLEKAALRTTEVTVAGEVLYVKEPTYAELTAWREAGAAGKVVEANAGLFEACVLTGILGNERLSTEDALTLAKGSVRVLTPLLAAITDQLKEEAKNG